MYIYTFLTRYHGSINIVLNTQLIRGYGYLIYNWLPAWWAIAALVVTDSCILYMYKSVLLNVFLLSEIKLQLLQYEMLILYWCMITNKWFVLKNTLSVYQISYHTGFKMGYNTSRRFFIGFIGSSSTENIDLVQRCRIHVEWSTTDYSNSIDFVKYLNPYPSCDWSYFK